MCIFVLHLRCQFSHILLRKLFCFIMKHDTFKLPITPYTFSFVLRIFRALAVQVFTYNQCHAYTSFPMLATTRALSQTSQILMYINIFMLISLFVYVC